MDEDDKPFYIVSYVTHLSSKRKLAQAALREEGQTPKSREENTGSDTSESLPGNLLQVSHKSHVDSGTSPGLGSDVPVIHAPKAEKKASRKRKRGARGAGAAKSWSKKNWTEAKLPEGSSKPTRLHLLKNKGLLARASRQEIKAISARESVFGSPSLELRTVLKILQEYHPLAQKVIFECTSVAKQPQADQRDQPSQPKQCASNFDPSCNATPKRRFHVMDKLVCYKNRWYIPPGLLRRELLQHHHDDEWSGHFAYCKTIDLLKRKYYWLKMSVDVQEYLDSCANCARAKLRRHCPYGELQSLLISNGPRQDWTLDFIIDLPPSVRRGQVFDSILVVVDQYTKYSKHIPSRKD